MAISTYLKRIERMNQLIRMKATGTPHEFADRMELSVSMLYKYLDAMKEMGAPIDYCKTRQTFYYESMGEFSLAFS